MVKLNTRDTGFSIIEILLSGSLFILIATGLIGAFVYAQSTVRLVEVRQRGVFLAEEGLEAVRNIRDSNYNYLVDGDYGLGISSNKWILDGSSDTTGIFTRQINISEISPNTKQVTSTVTWTDGSAILITYLTNFRGN